MTLSSERSAAAPVLQRDGPASGMAESGDARLGFLLALGATLSLSVGFVSNKVALQAFNPYAYTVVFMGGAALAVVALLAARGRLGILRPPAGLLGKALGIAVLNGAMQWCAWSGLQLLDASFASFLWRFVPLAAIVLSALVLGERLTRGEIAAIGVMIAGGLVSTWGDWGAVGLGALLTLAGCAAAGGQMVVAKTMTPATPPLALVFYRSAGAMVLVGLYALLTGQLHFPEADRAWMAAGTATTFGPLLGFYATFASYRHWSVSRSSMLLAGQPLFVLPLAYLVFRDLPTHRQLVGGAVILVGVLALTWMRLRAAAAAKRAGRTGEGESPALRVRP